MFKNLLFLSLAGLLTLTCVGQSGYNMHWYIGNSGSIDFTAGSPAITNSVGQANTGITPAVLSDAFGNLIAFTDGDTVFNAANQPLDNGVLPVAARENVFCPAPGTTDQYYLFRSSGAVGLVWSQLDMSVSGGNGGVDTLLNNVQLSQDNSQLVVTSHSNGTDFWVLAVDYTGTGNSVLQFTSYLVNNSGVNVVDSVEFMLTWANWTPPDDMRITLDCSKLAVSYKGHYHSLFNFDNSTGEVTTWFTDGAGGPDSFGVVNYMEFSPSGDYLYVVVDNSQLNRYDGNAATHVDFLASAETIATSAGDWTDLKLGPDNQLYIVDAINQELDRLVDPDMAMPTFEDSYLSVAGTSPQFMPSTINNCASQAFITTYDVCAGDSVHVSVAFPQPVDSVRWLISGPVADSAFNAYDTAFLLPVGSYTVEMQYLVVSQWDTLFANANVIAVPNANLGNDTALCAGDSLVLSVAGPTNIIVWNATDTAQTHTVFNAGTYWVNAQNGMCSAADTIVVTSVPQVALQPLSDHILCPGDPAVALIAVGSNYDSLLWSTGSTDTSVTQSDAGTYSVTVSNSCFSATESSTIAVVEFPDSIIQSRFEVCHFDAIPVAVNEPSYTIVWSTGDTGTATVLDAEGLYDVTLLEATCAQSYPFELVREGLDDIEDLVFPNVITINNDGQNEEFRPFLPSQSDAEVCSFDQLEINSAVFNRWGAVMARFNCTWQGDLGDATTVEPGIYYYVSDVTYTCESATQSKQYKGVVHVFR